MSEYSNPFPTIFVTMKSFLRYSPMFLRKTTPSAKRDAAEGIKP